MLAVCRTLSCAHLMEKCLLTIRSPSLGAPPGSRQRHQSDQTHVHCWELPLRWDLLSQEQRLFLKQQLTRRSAPATDLHLVSEPASRA